jgi:hypothetical protein
MNGRACLVSDLRVQLDIMPDIRVAKNGAPHKDDLTVLSSLLKTNWADRRLEWYYICANCFEDSVLADTHCIVGKQGADVAFALIHGTATPTPTPMPTLGLPHRGRVGTVEQSYVRQNLEAVNARREAEGFPRIDPSNPADAKRYGLAVQHLRHQE